MESRLEEKVRHAPPATEILRINMLAPARDRDDDQDGQRVDDLYVAVETRVFESEYDAILQVRVNPIILIKNDAYHMSELFSERNDGWFNSFQLTVDKFSKEVRFGPSGNIMVVPDECRGRGIASYAFAKLIRWAQEKYPDYKVCTVRVEAVDATPDNKERRNHFYEKHGFVGSFHDPGRKAGVYTCSAITALVPHEPSAGLQTLDVKEFVGKLLKDAQERKRELERLEGRVKSERERADELHNKITARNRVILILAVTLAALCLAIYYSA